jgi:hypothetical protein
MKRLAYILLLFVGIFLNACKKSQENHPVDFNLVGHWIYTQNSIGIGPPGVWRDAEPPNEVIEFKADGIFVPSKDFMPGATNYERIDSVTLKILLTSTPNGYIKMLYKIDSVDGRLTLQPIEPLCIEGCAYRFARK